MKQEDQESGEQQDWVEGPSSSNSVLPVADPGLSFFSLSPEVTEQKSRDVSLS